MLNEYRFQETWIERQTEILIYINFCGLMFFPPWAHAVQTIPHVLKTGYLVLNSLKIFLNYSLQRRTILKLLDYVIKGSRRIHKQQGSQKKNSNVLIKEASHCPGSAPRCSRRASASWSGKKTYHYESAGVDLEMALQIVRYYCLVLQGK